MSTLLTIAIPTYNRAEYLDRCLHHIHLQLQVGIESVEIFVSDNASTDATSEIIKKYINEGLPIQYHRNDVNKGADFNVLRCYNMGTGKYVWVLGDDDIIVNNGIQKVLSLLSIKGDGLGIVHLNHYFFEKDIRKSQDVVGVSVELYNDKFSFAKRINYHITFISANVINRDFLNSTLTDLYLGSNLTHLLYSTNALVKGPLNAYVRDVLVAGQAENTGGYNLFKVFGTNFAEILQALPPAYSNHIRRIMSNELLLRFFPHWIIKLKKGTNKFELATPTQELKRSYSQYCYYWISVFIMDKLPLPICTGYHFLIRGYVYFRRRIMSRVLKYTLLNFKPVSDGV